jgi:hypothetical protein
VQIPAQVCPVVADKAAEFPAEFRVGLDLSDTSVDVLGLLGRLREQGNRRLLGLY